MKRKIEPVYWGLLVFAILLLILILPNNPPEFFDIFGLVCFSFLLILGIWMLNTRKEVPSWAEFLVLAIAICGLLVDGYITFIR